MMRLKQFIGSQVIVAAGQWIANGLNVAFYLFAILLTPEQFSEVITLLSLALLFAVGQTAMQNDVLLLHRERVPLASLLRSSLVAATRYSVLLAAGMAAASPALSAFFGFRDIVPFIVLGAGAGFHFFTGVAQGMLLVRRRFVALAISLVSVTAGRLPIGYAFFRNGYAPSDTAWIIFLSGLLMVLLNAWMIRGDLALLRESAADAAHRVPEAKRSAVAPLLISTLLFSFALRLDVLWAKHALTPREAGVYGVLNTIAIFLFYATSSVARTSLSYLSAKTLHTILLWSGTLIAVCTAAAVMLFWGVGDALIGWVFGAAYVGQLPALFLLLLSAACLALVNLGMQSMHVLDDRHVVPLMVVLVAAQAVALSAFGDSLVHVAAANLCVLAVMIVLFLRHLLARHHPLAPVPLAPVLHGSF